MSATLFLSSLSIAMIQINAPAALAFEIPESWSVPNGQKLLSKSKAKGDRIYTCQGISNDASGYGNQPDTYC
jgi:hypothetical protein